MDIERVTKSVICTAMKTMERLAQIAREGGKAKQLGEKIHRERQSFEKHQLGVGAFLLLPLAVTRVHLLEETRSRLRSFERIASFN